MKMTKDELLKYLEEDKDIQKAIKKIVKKKEEKIDNDTQEKDKEIEMLKGLIEKWKKCFNDEQAKTQNLSSLLEQRNKEIEKLNTYKTKILQEIDSLEQEKKQKELALQEEKSTNKTLNKIVNLYRDSFEDELRVYESYMSLSDTTKSSLKGIFKDDTIQGFFSCGVQEKNISSLWEYIKNEIIEDKNPDIKKLISIFNFLFERYLLAFPIYKKQDVSIGENFDPQSHIKDSKSTSVSGKIKEITLYGWINIKTGKVVKQSVVVI
jgi:DNA repair exonuclease SbcCD ATPase subunit